MSWLINSGAMNTGAAPTSTGFDPYNQSINKGRPEFIGKPGYDRALAAGYSPNQINSAITDAGIKTGPYSGYSAPPPFDASDPTYNKGRVEVFGSPAYRRATEAGFTDEQIQASIDELGLHRSKNVPGFVAPERPTYERPPLDLTNSRINRGREDIIGMHAVTAAQNRGYTVDDINAALANSSIKVGAKANQALGRSSYKSQLFDRIVNSI